MTVTSSTRRSFLKTSSVLAGTAAFSSRLFADEKPAAQDEKEKLRIAVIGCGGRGGSNLS